MNFWVWGIFNLFDHGLVRFLLDRFSPGETGRAALIGGAFALSVIVPYLLGSVNCALLISRFVYHDDIRKYGSGNAGSTNMLRTYGKKASIITFAGDGLKGVIAVIFACLLFGAPESEPFFIYLVDELHFGVKPRDRRDPCLHFLPARRRFALHFARIGDDGADLSHSSCQF